jgi:uncharacterized protein (TIGR04551 family)
MRLKHFASFSVCMMAVVMAGSLYAEPTDSKTELPLPRPIIPVEVEEATPKESVSVEKEAQTDLVEKRWGTYVKTKLNFLDLEGYFRMRLDVFNRCDLGTLMPPDADHPLPRGTSNCPVPISYFKTPDSLTDETDVSPSNRSSTLFSMNMRLRVNPTLSVSEDLRIRGTVDLFDNLVLGSTPSYMTGSQWANSLYPTSFFSNSQEAPLQGINTPWAAIALKRVWGEATTPVGELRFGRIPFNFGLGVLFNAGSGRNDDYADSVDGIFFATRIGEHYLIPGYAIHYAGPVGSGGGYQTNYRYFFQSESAQPFDLDPSDNVHSLYLTFLKREDPNTIKERVKAGDVVVDYGALLSYRFQAYESAATKVLDPETDRGYKLVNNFTLRNSSAGIMSLYSGVFYENLRIELEFAGLLGYIANTEGIPWENGPMPNWIVKGGGALVSRYGLLSNKLGLGLDAGWASGGSSSQFGFGGPENNPNANVISNFRFHPNFQVDQILFKNVIGAVTNAYYVRPHIDYFFAEGFGVEGDILAAFANNSDATPGKSPFLGMEFDARFFYQSVDGFFVSSIFGVMVPFAGLNHPSSLQNSEPKNYQLYGTARTAIAFELMAGIAF